MAGAVLAIGTVLGVLAPVAGSTAAWAGGPQHVKSTISGQLTLRAGRLCDFTYHNAFTGTDNAIIFPDKMIEHIVINATHTNVNTGFTLTETDHFTLITAAGQTKETGVQWHLRTADGKIVVVHAGKIVFSSTGKVLSFTPNTSPDFGAVVCPALGGHTAG